MMEFSSIYHKLVLLSPQIEVMVRRLYWNNVKYLQHIRNASTHAIDIKDYQNVDIAKITDFLQENGICKNDIVVIHSSFDVLKATGLSVEEIINKLYDLVGDLGTLAMPAIREFTEESGTDYLVKYIDNEMKGVTTLYDVYRTPVSSGLLPFILMHYDDAVISKFPLNPMVAIGAHATAMMEHNIDGELLSAHGSNSSWAYCASHDAWNVGIGVDMKDYLTIFHVAQEGVDWPVKDWFFERDFVIKKGKKEIPLRIRERKHKWTKYFAESNFYQDLSKAGILKSTIIDGIPIYITRSKALLDYIRQQKVPCYPYYIPQKYLK